MKRTLLIIAALLMVSGGLFAQNRYYRHDAPRVHGGVYIGNNYNFDYDYNVANNLYAMYGSEYRRARVERNSGILLTTVVAPLSAIVACQALYLEEPGPAILGITGVLGGLGAGIPLWVDGQRKIDWMTDDYLRTFRTRGPGLRIGAGRNGFGFSLNF